MPLLAACGGAPAERAQADALQRRMTVLDEAFAAQEQRIEQLKDRLALLEDRQEAVQLQAPPRELPVVRLRPPTPAVELTAPEPVDEAPPPDERPAVTITQADLDALGGGGYEPDGGGQRRLPRQPVEPPENAALAGNIGVVPVQPPRRLADGAPRALPPAAAPGADEAIAAYKLAYALYRDGDSGRAEPALRDFVARYGRHDYADNALFWVGQIQFDEGRAAAALETFRRVVTDYPSGNKVPDALLMIGLTQARLGQAAQGRETLARLRAMYPQTEAARKADARLQPGSM